MGIFSGAVIRALLALILVTAGSLWLTLETTRDYLHQQMGSQAQDTANSLALALQPYIATDDLLTADTMITALVQSGYYTSITLYDVDGTVLIHHDTSAVVLPVPEFFPRIFPIQAPTAEAAITRGWDTAATVRVTSHAALAHRQLWRLALGILGLGIAGTALMIALLWQWSRRQKRESNAEPDHINRKNDALLQRAQFDERNSHTFNRQLRQLQQQALMDTSTLAAGHLLLVHISNLEDVTRKIGRKSGDNYTQTMMAILHKHIRNGCGRLRPESGDERTQNIELPIFQASMNELALLCHCRSREDACMMAQNICGDFAELTGGAYPKGFGHIGIVPFTARHTARDILARGAVALERAQGLGINRWYYLADAIPEPRPLSDMATLD